MKKSTVRQCAEQEPCYFVHLVRSYELMNYECNSFFNSLLTHYFIETPFDAFANRADSYQAALIRAA